MALLTLTILSTALAATTSVWAWRVIRREARRLKARIAALSGAIHGPEAVLSMATSAAMASFPSEFAVDAVADKSVLSLPGHRVLATLSATALVVVGLLIFTATTQRGGPTIQDSDATAEMSAAARSAAQAAVQATAAAPLELIALSHERGKDALVVRGAIRNPSNGTMCEVPAVVVLTFDEHGLFLGTSESDESGGILPPGAQTTFTVHVPAGTTAPARYRVSFRSAGHVVPHVDKRVPVTAGTGLILDAPNAPHQGPVRS